MTAKADSGTSGAGQVGRGGFDLSLSRSSAFPPVTGSTAPVMSLASAEASSTYAGASAAGWPARASGTCSPKLAACDRQHRPSDELGAPLKQP